MKNVDDDGSHEGRSAERPAEIPPAGWLDIVKRVKASLKEAKS